MTFAYPKRTHVTLPSVEGFNGTLNIMRDPNRGVYTRFIKKVSDTSDLTEWVGGSGDRICEGIQVYSRGVNPFVSVDYSNNGSNGGRNQQHVGSVSAQTSGQISNNQAYLPYRVARDGAYRPPVISPQELLPLSRQPVDPLAYRSNPSQLMNPSNGAGSDSMSCNSAVKRSIKDEMPTICVPGKAIFNLETPGCKIVDVKNMVRDKTYLNIESNKQQDKYILGSNAVPARGIDKDKTYSTITANVFRNVDPLPVTYLGNQKIATKDTRNISCQTNVSGPEMQPYIHAQQELNRNRPIAMVELNKFVRGVDINSEIQNRNVYLAPRSKRGGFENSGSLQRVAYNSDIQKSGNYDSILNNNVYRQAAGMQSRYAEPYRS